MRDAIAKITNKIKKTIKSINFKSKKTLLFIGLFVFALTTSLILISYGHYVKPGDKTLVVSGYALVSDADITLKIYIEDKDSTGNGVGTYSRAYYIPTANYTYNTSSSYCTEGITIDSFQNGKFNITSTSKGYCKVYFDAVDGYAPDATFKLFVEQTKDASDYEEAGMLPDNDYVYKVNSTRTSCTDPNAVVEVVKRKIEITASMDNECTVYVDIEALTGGAINSLSDTVIGLVSDNEYTSSQDGTKYVVRHEEVTHNGQTLDAGVRYEGKDPDNYVTFNGNEEWRIIGVFEGSTIGLEPGKQYIKIIKNASIGNFSWDSYYMYDWEQAKLNDYLNGNYINSLTNKTMIENALWYLRGVSIDDQDIYTLNDWFMSERLLGKTASISTDNVVFDTAPATTYAMIGLMYPSDYGYAAYGISCNSQSTLILYSQGCASVDWLAQYTINNAVDEWLITPLTEGDPAAAFASSGGYVFADYTAHTNLDELAVRPTLYLSNNVFITSGTGKKSDPYNLGL